MFGIVDHFEAQTEGVLDRRQHRRDQAIPAARHGLFPTFDRNRAGEQAGAVTAAPFLVIDQLKLVRRLDVIGLEGFPDIRCVVLAQRHRPCAGRAG